MKKPEFVGLKNNSLSPCPGRPNCVSSVNQEEDLKIMPFELVKQESWVDLKKLVSNQENYTVISSTENYLHIECKTNFLRFIDDLELHLQKDGTIQVRSSSRLGYSDFGVNRKRVEKLRAKLKEAGIIK